MLRPIDYSDVTGQEWEGILTQTVANRASFLEDANQVQYTRVVQHMLGVFDDAHHMQDYLYTLKSLPINWTLLFDELPKAINPATRTEIISILQLHKEQPLSINRMVAFFSGRDLLPLMNTKYRAHMAACFKQWLEKIEAQYPKLSHPNNQRIFLDLTKWCQHYFPIWIQQAEPPKILWYGDMTESEAYFIYFLYLFGCDLVIFHPEGKNTLAQYGLQIAPEVKLALTVPLFDFPHDKPLQVKTMTARSSDLVRQTIFETSNVNYPWKYLDFETRPIFLNTTYDEMFILNTAKMELREGFDADETSVYLPVLFGKIEGVTNYLPQYQDMLKKLQRQELTLLTNEFPLIEPQRANMQFYVKDASINGELNAEKMIQMANWPYKTAPAANQLNIARTIIQMIDLGLLQRLPNESDTDYKGYIMGQLFKLPQEVLRLYRQFDYSYDNPTYAVFVEENVQVQRSDATLLIFLACLGFDVLLFAPGSEMTVEPYLTQPILMVHRLEKIEFHLKLEELLVENKVQEQPKLSLKAFLQRLKRKD